jgi:hypothetical protein
MTPTLTASKNRTRYLQITTAATDTEDPATPLFSCSRCNCVEDTALCHYWSARLRQNSAVCSACDPTIGRWHGEFPRQSDQGWISDRSGFLLDKGSVERWLGQPIELFAKPGQDGPSVGSDLVKAHVLALDAEPSGTSVA